MFSSINIHQSLSLSLSLHFWTILYILQIMYVWKCHGSSRAGTIKSTTRFEQDIYKLGEHSDRLYTYISLLYIYIRTPNIIQWGIMATMDIVIETWTMKNYPVKLVVHKRGGDLFFINSFELEKIKNRFIARNFIIFYSIVHRNSVI